MKNEEEFAFSRDEKTLANSLTNFFEKEESKFSDHLPIKSKDSTVISWNTLQRMETWTGGGDGKTVFFNNGFGKTENPESYEKRAGDLLAYVTEQTGVGVKRGHLPVHIICLQEMQLNDEKIAGFLKNGFKVAQSPENQESLSQVYGNEGCRLVMLYNPKRVGLMGKCDLKELNLCKEERYQAVKFYDKKTQMPFMVVNVHQDYGSVELGEKPALGNLKLIQRHFAELPCIITGDFNTNNLSLENEAGKIREGKNTNIIWDVPTGKTRETLGACDHIIMNAAYCNQLLPALQTGYQKHFNYLQGFQHKPNIEHECVVENVVSPSQLMF